MSRQLELSDPTAEMALQVYGQVLETEYNPPSLDGLAAACLYISAQSRGKTLGDVSDVARKETKVIRTIAQRISDEIGVPIELQTPVDILDANCEALGIESYREELEELLAAVDDEYKGAKAPSGVAAGAIYVGTQLFDYDIRQKDIAEELNTTEVTIRTRYPEIYQHSDINPPKEERKFESFDEAMATFRAEFDELPEQVFERAEAHVTLAKDDMNITVSEAGVVLGALLAAAETLGETREWTHPEGLSKYASVAPQTIRRYRDRFKNDE